MVMVPVGPVGGAGYPILLRCTGDDVLAEYRKVNSVWAMSASAPVEWSARLMATADTMSLADEGEFRRRVRASPH
jgi:hypothetical protein